MMMTLTMAMMMMMMVMMIMMMVTSGHRETTALELIAIYIAEIQNSTVQPGTFSDNQPQWFTLQLHLETVGVTECI